MRCVCGQLRGVTLERNKKDYFKYDSKPPCRIVVDGVEVKK